MLICEVPLDSLLSLSPFPFPSIPCFSPNANNVGAFAVRALIFQLNLLDSIRLLCGTHLKWNASRKNREEREIIIKYDFRCAPAQCTFYACLYLKLIAFLFLFNSSGNIKFRAHINRENKINKMNNILNSDLSKDQRPHSIKRAHTPYTPQSLSGTSIASNIHYIFI